MSMQLLSVDTVQAVTTALLCSSTDDVWMLYTTETPQWQQCLVHSSLELADLTKAELIL